jgi:prepilin-type N-terminal cleavage/methylation domain-containing protein
VNRHGDRLRLSSQDGYTALEMIITMALTAIVSGAIFSSFLVLDRIQTAWEQREQARTVGVLAEAPLLRDVQAYQVMTKTGNTLILQGVSTDRLSKPFKVTYFVQPSPGGESSLKRNVEQPPDPPSFATTVAHGVQSIKVDCAGNTLTIGMTLDAISTRVTSTPESVVVSPVLTLTPRNGTCPS